MSLFSSLGKGKEYTERIVTIPSSVLLASISSGHDLLDLSLPNGKAIKLKEIRALKASGIGYSTATDILFKYTNTGGTTLGTLSQANFAALTTAETREVTPTTANYRPVEGANGKIIASSTGNWIGGNQDIKVLFVFKIIDTSF